MIYSRKVKSLKIKGKGGFSLKRIFGIIACVMGVVSLIVGVLLVVQASSAENEIIDQITEEGFPVITFDNQAYPYLGITDPTAVLDTADEIDAVADAFKAARQEIAAPPVGAAGFQSFFAPSTVAPEALGVEVDTVVFHEYAGILAFETTMNSAKAGLALTALVRIIGIATIVIGLGVISAGLVGVFKED